MTIEATPGQTMPLPQTPPVVAPPAAVVAPPVPAAAAPPPPGGDADLRAALAVANKKLADIQALDQKGKDETFLAEHNRLKAYEAAGEKAKADGARESIKTKNVQDLLATIAEDKRADAELLVLGMAAKGTVDLYQADAATKLIEALGTSRADWFIKPPPNAGLAGGSPGVGLPQGGSLLTLPAEQIAAMSDDQLKAAMAAGRSTSRRI